MALTAARVNQLLSYRGKFKVTTDPQPLTEAEQTGMLLKLDRTVLFPRRDDSHLTAKPRPRAS